MGVISISAAFKIVGLEEISKEVHREREREREENSGLSLGQISFRTQRRKEGKQQRGLSR